MDKKNEKLNVAVFDYSTIPKFMKNRGRFCLWKLVMKPGKLNPDKIPYRIDGKKADVTNPQHYSSFKKLWRHLRMVVIQIYVSGTLPQKSYGNGTI